MRKTIILLTLLLIIGQGLFAQRVLTKDERMAWWREASRRVCPAQEERTFDQYIDDVAVPEVRELLTNYGDVAVLWWDTPANMTDEAAARLQSLLTLQPAIITKTALKSQITRAIIKLPSRGSRIWPTSTAPTGKPA
jgi:hypothetical protein